MHLVDYDAFALLLQINEYEICIRIVITTYDIARKEDTLKHRY